MLSFWNIADAAAAAQFTAANEALRGRNNINDNSRYVAHYNQNIIQVAILPKHFKSWLPTELLSNERYVFLKDLTTENDWIFELGIESGIYAPVFFDNIFQDKNRFWYQDKDNALLRRPTVSMAQSIIRTETNKDESTS